MTIKQGNENGGVFSPTADREVVTALANFLQIDTLTNADVISACEDVITRLTPPQIDVYDFRDDKDEIEHEHRDCAIYDRYGDNGEEIPTDVELDAFLDGSDYEPVVFTHGVVTPGQIITAVKEHYGTAFEEFRRERAEELAEMIHAEKMIAQLLESDDHHVMPQALCEFLNVPQNSSYGEGRKVWKRYQEDRANKEADDRERNYVERIRTGADRNQMGFELCEYLDIPKGSWFIEGRKALAELETAALLVMENLKQKGLTATRTTTSIITVTGGSLGTDTRRCKMVVAQEAEVVAQ